MRLILFIIVLFFIPLLERSAELIQTNCFIHPSKEHIVFYNYPRGDIYQAKIDKKLFKRTFSHKGKFRTGKLKLKRCKIRNRLTDLGSLNLTSNTFKNPIRPASNRFLTNVRKTSKTCYHFIAMILLWHLPITSNQYLDSIEFPGPSYSQTGKSIRIFIENFRY